MLCNMSPARIFSYRLPESFPSDGSSSFSTQSHFLQQSPVQYDWFSCLPSAEHISVQAVVVFMQDVHLQFIQGHPSGSANNSPWWPVSAHSLLHSELL